MNKPVTSFAESPVTEADIATYEQDGVVCLRGLFDDYWLDKLRAATERSLAAGGMELAKEEDGGRFHNNLFLWARDADVRDFVFESPAAGIAKALMRARQVRLYFDHLFVKEPGTQTPTPWHHDQPYWPVRGEQVCSIWVTMDPVTPATGGLDYIKASHRWGKRFNPAEFGASKMAGLLGDEENDELPDIDANRDRYELLNWDMQPGDCLVHHSLAVHGAAGNSSSAIRRRALSTRWLGDDAVYWPLPTKMPGSPLDPPDLVKGGPMTTQAFPVVGG